MSNGALEASLFRIFSKVIRLGSRLGATQMAPGEALQAIDGLVHRRSRPTASKTSPDAARSPRSEDHNVVQLRESRAFR